MQETPIHLASKKLKLLLLEMSPGVNFYEKETENKQMDIRGLFF